MRKLLSLCLTASALCPNFACAQAQIYPNKAIRMIVGFPPGGGTDIVARLLAPRLSENLGQSIVIDNRAGATGTVAAGIVAKSPPDGYTLMMGHVSVNAIAPSLFSKLPYDAIKDFSPITLTASVPHFITVHPSLPVASVKELIAHAKAQPGKLSFPSAGNGSTPHLAGEMFKTMAVVNLLHVPYKGSGQAIQPLLAGQHQVAFDTMPASAPYVRAGRMRLIAVSGAKRLSEFGDVPTMEEAGLQGYRITTWYGAFAPAGTAPAIVGRLHAEFQKAMRAHDIHPKLVDMGADDTVSRSPADFAAIVRADLARYAKLVKDAGLQID